MNEELQALSKIHYGKSPVGVLSIDGKVPVVGTGGVYGFATRSMFESGIVVARKGSLGMPHLLTKPFWPVDTTYAVIPRSDINLDWLYYCLINFDLTKLNEATGVPSINRNWLARTKIFNPGSARQDKVAAILRSVDTAIEKTKVLIDKYRQIKAGVMHDLFTRGVLLNHKLRPPRSEAPELYQETAIGFIPRGWHLRSCGELCTRICVGIVIQPTQYYTDEGIPAFRSANVREDGIDPSNLVYISSISNNLLKKSQVKSGDILSVRTGYPGTSAVVPPEFTGSNCIDILISTPGNSVTSEYLCAWINSTFGKEQVLRQQGGMAQQHFNVAELRELLVALPDIEEQNRIQSRIEGISRKIKSEQALLEKLRTQKLGLMQDLLTGKVPVKTDEPEAPHA